MKGKVEGKYLPDCSWQVAENEYRQDPALSYSTIARFHKGGYEALKTLYDKVETPSLSFGSAVDTYVTGGKEEFDKLYFIADIPTLPDGILKMVNQAFIMYSVEYKELVEIPDAKLIELSTALGYQLNWKPETRARVVKEQGTGYYRIMYLAMGKKILTSSQFEEIRATVRALKEAPATRDYFMEDNPFDSIERFYQLKFKATFNGIGYKCMADLLLVDHDKKAVYPVDLKTTGKPEHMFFKSFIEWGYQIQARLYWRIIRDAMDKGGMEDYALANYVFAVVNKDSLTPLKWEFQATKDAGNIIIPTESGGRVAFEDPEYIGGELYSYLEECPEVPFGIVRESENDILSWIKKM